jgi:hypothetical protein
MKILISPITVFPLSHVITQPLGHWLHFYDRHWAFIHALPIHATLAQNAENRLANVTLCDLRQCKRQLGKSFSVQCRQCPRWYHGECVQLTVETANSINQQMLEWICRRCHLELLVESNMFQEAVELAVKHDDFSHYVFICHTGERRRPITWHYFISNVCLWMVKVEFFLHTLWTGIGQLVVFVKCVSPLDVSCFVEGLRVCLAFVLSLSLFTDGTVAYFMHTHTHTDWSTTHLSPTNWAHACKRA